MREKGVNMEKIKLVESQTISAKKSRLPSKRKLPGFRGGFNA